MIGMIQQAEVRPRFHLAVPVDDLAQASEFYGVALGCERGRSADTWIDWNFRGHQFVTHLAPARIGGTHNAVDGKSVPVPHFGLILTVDDFHELSAQLAQRRTKFLIEPYLRFAGEPGEQWTMFLNDPAGNALEFKAFADETQIFAT
jgi:extradiol dioxygenase family protein